MTCRNVIRESRCAAGALLAVLMLAALPALGAPPDRDGFLRVKVTRDGITVSRKAGRTRGYYVNRIETRSGVAPERLFEGLWKVFDNAYPPVAKREFMSREEDEIVFNDHVRTPVVSDREYTLRARRFPDGMLYRITFETDPEAGPAPVEGYVRMPMVCGGWWVRSDGAGGSLVTYEVYTEPGGMVPALLVRDPLTEDAVSYVRRCMQDAAQK